MFEERSIHNLISQGAICFCQSLRSSLDCMRHYRVSKTEKIRLKFHMHSRQLNTRTPYLSCPVKGQHQRQGREKVVENADLFHSTNMFART
jgi:hypothetical protein